MKSQRNNIEKRQNYNKGIYVRRSNGARYVAMKTTGRYYYLYPIDENNVMIDRPVRVWGATDVEHPTISSKPNAPFVATKEYVDVTKPF